MVPAWFLGWFHLVLAMAKPIKIGKQCKKNESSWVGSHLVPAMAKPIKMSKSCKTIVSRNYARLVNSGARMAGQTLMRACCRRVRKQTHQKEQRPYQATPDSKLALAALSACARKLSCSPSSPWCSCNPQSCGQASSSGWKRGRAQKKRSTGAPRWKSRHIVGTLLVCTPVGALGHGSCVCRIHRPEGTSQTNHLTRAHFTLGRK